LCHGVDRIRFVAAAEPLVRRPMFLGIAPRWKPTENNGHAISFCEY
jgi:hypothetical protein